ncbi:hypothetical protein BS47DRAFT_1369432 [Hydnum rufescens UP504]|uniref:Uncharacterized protein n=1 Tax=Hydnum rufescens UP504 TaxID=1448309 RepID=A0A9P6ACX0_9AGAM|nr:hypothetical protein BS47DRAFT_1369432 [Hydnum rufescens UP504]
MNPRTSTRQNRRYLRKGGTTHPLQWGAAQAALFVIASHSIDRPARTPHQHLPEPTIMIPGQNTDFKYGATHPPKRVPSLSENPPDEDTDEPPTQYLMRSCPECPEHDNRFHLVPHTRRGPAATHPVAPIQDGVQWRRPWYHTPAVADHPLREDLRDESTKTPTRNMDVQPPKTVPKGPALNTKTRLCTSTA